MHQNCSMCSKWYKRDLLQNCLYCLNENAVDAVEDDQGYDVASTEGTMKLSNQPAAQEGPSEKSLNSWVA